MKKIIKKKNIIEKTCLLINKHTCINVFNLNGINSNNINYLRKISVQNNIKIIICKNKLLNIVFDNKKMFLLKNKFIGNNILLCHDNDLSISYNIFNKFILKFNLKNNNIKFIYFDNKIYSDKLDLIYISKITNKNDLIIKFCNLIKNISIIRLYIVMKKIKNNIK